MKAKSSRNWFCKCCTRFNSETSKPFCELRMKLSIQTFIVFCASILIILELIQILTNGIETDVVWTRYKDRERTPPDNFFLRFEKTKYRVL